MAAPLAATIFADLGAEVVKVERPGGDPMRADPSAFAAWNRGKRTVELDLGEEHGRRELGALLDQADLLIENLRPGSLERRLFDAGDGNDDGGRRERAAHRRAAAWPAAAGHLLDQWMGQQRAVTRRAGLGAAGAGPRRHAAGPVHRRRRHLATLPRRQRGRCPARRARRRRRAGQARVDGLRPARRDLAARRAALPQRGAHLPPAGPPAPRLAPEELGRPASLRDRRRPLRHGEPQRYRALARAVPPARDRRRRARLRARPRASRGSPTRSGTGPSWPRSPPPSLSRTADEWEAALLESPAAVAKCNTLAEWLDSDRPGPTTWCAETDDPVLGRVPLLGPTRADRGRARRAEARPPARRRAGRARWAPHRRPLQFLGRAAGVAPAGRARGRRREGGAAGRRGRVPDDAGPAQHLRRRQPLQAGAGARPQGADRPGPAARPGGRVRRRGRERGGRRVGAARARRGGAAGGQPGAGLRPGQGLRLGRAAGQPGPRSTTWCRRRRGWR